MGNKNKQQKTLQGSAPSSKAPTPQKQQQQQQQQKGSNPATPQKQNIPAISDKIKSSPATNNVSKPLAANAAEPGQALSKNQLKKLRKQQKQQEQSKTDKPQQQAQKSADKPQQQKPQNAKPQQQQQQGKPAVKNVQASGAAKQGAPAGKPNNAKKPNQQQQPKTEPCCPSESDDDDDDDETEELPEEIISIEDELAKVEEEMDVETTKIVSRFDLRRRPLYLKRRESLKKIPGFWFNVMINHDEFANYLEEADFDILEHINDVYVEYNDSGFKLTFSFESGNPYIENSECNVTVRTTRALSKLSRDEITAEHMTDRVISCDKITWKENMQPAGLDTTSSAPTTAGKKRPMQYAGLFKFFSPKADPVESASIFNLIANEIFPDAVNYHRYPNMDADMDSDDEDEDDDDEDDGKHLDSIDMDSSKNDFSSDEDEDNDQSGGDDDDDDDDDDDSE